MKKSTYKRFKDICNSYDSKSILGRHSHAFLNKKLLPLLEEDSSVNTEEAQQDLNIEKIQIGEVCAFPHNTYSIHTLLKRSARLTESIMKSAKPNYWESWAHKSRNVSFVVQEYPEITYAKTFIYRSISQIVCGCESLMKDPKVTLNKRLPRGVILLNKIGNAYCDYLFKYVKISLTSASAIQTLLNMWSSTSIKVTYTNPIEFSIVPTKKIDFYSFETYIAFNNYIYNLIKQGIPPVKQVGNYEFFVLDYRYLLLLILFDRFPKQFNLKHSNKFFINVINNIPRFFNMDADISIRNNTPILFIWSKHTIDNKIFFIDSISKMNTPRKIKNEKSHEYLTHHYTDRKTEKLDNKVFFNVENLLNNSDLHDQIKVRNRLLKLKRIYNV